MIHKTAIIHPKAQIERDVNIGPYCVIGADTRIQSGTELISHVVVEGDTSIGKNNKIYPFVSLGMEPQHLKFRGETSKLIIGNNNIIRESVVIHRGTLRGENKTVIGNDNFIMSTVHIGHDCILGDHIIIASGTGVAGHVTLQDRVNLGGMVGIAQFVRIGKSTFIGAGSEISKDIPPFCLCTGMRGQLCIRGVNVVGLKRQGFSVGEIRKLKLAFEAIFDKNNPLQENIRNLEQEFKTDKAISYVLDFIKSSKIGLITEWKN